MLVPCPCPASLLCCSYCFKTKLGVLLVRFCVPFTYSHPCDIFFLSSSLLSGTTRYKMRRAHLDVSCPSLRIIIYFSRSTGLFLENGVRDQGLGPGCAHVLHFFFFWYLKKDVAVLLFSFWSKRSFVCILFGDYIMGRVIMDASLSGVDLFCACCPFRFNIKHKNVLNYWLAS